MKIDNLGRVVLDDKKLLEKINGAFNILDILEDNGYCPHVNERCQNVPCPDKDCYNYMCTCGCQSI